MCLYIYMCIHLIVLHAQRQVAKYVYVYACIYEHNMCIILAIYVCMWCHIMCVHKHVYTFNGSAGRDAELEAQTHTCTNHTHTQTHTQTKQGARANKRQKCLGAPLHHEERRAACHENPGQLIINWGNTASVFYTKIHQCFGRSVLTEYQYWWWCLSVLTMSFHGMV